MEMKSLYPTIILLLLLQIPHGFVRGSMVDNFRFVNFSAKDGLPDKFIYAITQDKMGFIWVGGNNGLYRYDGVKFKHYKSPIDIPDHQISNVLTTIYYDSTTNMLWLGSMNAVQYLDLNTYTFHTPNLALPDVDEMISSRVTAFYRDSKNRMWIGTEKGIWYHYNEKNNKVKRYSNIESSIFNPILAFAEKAGKVIVFSGRMILKFDPITGKKETLSLPTSVAQAFIRSVYYDAQNGMYWLALGEKGVVSFSLHDLSFGAPYAFTSQGVHGKTIYSSVKQINRNQDGKYWINTSTLGLSDLKSRKIENIDSPNSNEYSLRSTNISILYTDRQQNLWVGTFDRGLSMHSYQNQHIKSFPLINPQGYSVEPFSTAHLPNSDNFVVTGNLVNGVAVFDSKNGGFTFIKPADGSKSYSRYSHTTKLGKTYVSIENKIYEFDTKNSKLIPLQINTNDGSSLPALYEIISDSDGNLYVAASKTGIYKIIVKTKTAIFIPLPQKAQPKGKHKPMLEPIPALCDSKDNIWCVNTSGVYCLLKSTDTFVHMATEKAKNTGASVLISTSISESEPGVYWITTKSNGFFKLTMNSLKGTLINYSGTNLNMNSDFCFNALPQNKETIWIINLQGLLRFDVKSERITAYVGSQHGMYSDNSAYGINILPSGKILTQFFGAISVLDVNTFPYNQQSFPPVVTSLKIMDHLITSKPIFSDTSFDLSYRQNLIQIDFATLNLCNSNQNSYRYKLEGIDTKWHYTENVNTASYSGMAPGKYVFHLQVSNNNGVWYPKELNLQFRINPPFWKTWWFILILGTVFSGVALLFNYLFIRYIKREVELKSDFSQQIAEMELKALRAQMNPHFIFNSLNSIQKYVLQNDQYTASQYLTRFSRLIRLILDHSVQNMVFLASEIDMIKLYIDMESLRFDHKFNFNLQVDENLDIDRILAPSMLIQPYIENAIWHGLLYKTEKGDLLLKISKKENILEVVIDDNGIGRQKSEELKKNQVMSRKSYGIKITEDRINLINRMTGANAGVQINDKYHADGSAAGTTVILHLPLNQ